MNKLKRLYEVLVIFNRAKQSLQGGDTNLIIQKQQGVMQQIERIVTPGRKRFVNIVGEYIYEILSPNCICFMVTCPLILNYGGLIGSDRSQIVVQVFWNT